jgi:hypothetical protein
VIDVINEKEEGGGNEVYICIYICICNIYMSDVINEKEEGGGNKVYICIHMYTSIYLFI